MATINTQLQIFKTTSRTLKEIADLESSLLERPVSKKDAAEKAALHYLNYLQRKVAK